MRALRKHQFLALFRRIRLDDADPAERFGETPRDLGVDLAPLAEERPQPLERVGHSSAERPEDHDGD